MSKLCVKCGAPLEDAAMFCNICGSQQSAPQQPAYQQPAYQQPVQQPVYGQPAPKQPKKAVDPGLKKKILIGAGAVAAVALIIILLCVLIKPAGAGAIDTTYEVYIEGEMDNFEKVLPEGIWEWYEDKMELSIGDCQDQAEDEAKETKKDLKKTYGSDYEIDYKIVETNELDESDVNKIASKMEKQYGKKYLNKNDVEAIKQVWVQITIEGKKDKNIYIERYDVIKIDGEWYCGYVSKDYKYDDDYNVKSWKYSDFSFEASFYNEEDDDWY